MAFSGSAIGRRLGMERLVNGVGCGQQSSWSQEIPEQLLSWGLGNMSLICLCMICFRHFK